MVEPSGPINVGSVARLCSNFEVSELRLVSPKCDFLSLETKKMALGLSGAAPPDSIRKIKYSKATQQICKMMICTEQMLSKKIICSFSI